MFTPLIFFIILSILVLVHEFGHFIFAKRAGMRVDEFGLGFPPRIFSIQKGETRYSFNLIPFGGFVKIYGEDGESEGKDKNNKRLFTNQPKKTQATVIVAGVFFNFLLAWTLFSGGLALGTPSVVGSENSENISDVRVHIVEVIPNSPALDAGLIVGDRILALTSLNDELQNVTHFDDVAAFISEAEVDTITFLVERGREELVLNVTPKLGIVEDTYAIGIVMENIGILKLPVGEAIIKGFVTTTKIAYLTIKTLAGLIGGIFTGSSDLSSISGPVGIYSLVGEASVLGFSYLVSLTALISISLAVINIAPFPALDGGRLLILFIETIKGAPLKPKYTQVMNLVGFVILILFMLIITFNDLIRIGVFSFGS